jgi:hypothetical protein
MWIHNWIRSSLRAFGICFYKTMTCSYQRLGDLFSRITAVVVFPMHIKNTIIYMFESLDL